MQIILLETAIAAPPDRCFLLSLSIDLHKDSTAGTGEQAIAGVTSGLIGPNQTVTWRGRHFGFSLTHHTLISQYERPTHFQDIMLRGMFRSFEHDHYFTPTSTGTLMRDELRFAAPLGPLGWIAERVALTSHLTRFLRIRNNVIREAAESPDIWPRYLPQTCAKSAE